MNPCQLKEETGLHHKIIDNHCEEIELYTNISEINFNTKLNKKQRV